MILLATLVFIFGYLFIALEHKLHISKSAFALAMGGILWAIVSFQNPGIVNESLKQAGYDIFNLVIFILAAMSLVEILIHYRVFDVVRGKMLRYHLTDKEQFVAIMVIAFALSLFVPNFTATIIMIQIARKFFKNGNLLIAATGIVIVTNASGSFSPIGDVTTIMLWLAGAFDVPSLLLQGFLPALALLGVVIFLMRKKINNQDYDDLEGEVVTKLCRSEKIIVLSVILSFILPLFAKSLDLPPVLGILLGLGITWIVVDLMKSVSKNHSHLTATIEELIQKTDIGTIKFFIGILLSVAALEALGILEIVSHAIYGSGDSTAYIVFGNVLLGVISALLDNIPLTAIAIKILPAVHESLWVLLSLTVGMGGSLLLIGSAAGVVAGGLVKELTFAKYLKYGFVPALVGMLVAVGVWGLQYILFVA